MTSEYFLAFKLLRAVGKLGLIWTVEGGYRMAPVTLDGYCMVPPMMQWDASEFMTERSLELLLDRLSGVERKPVQSEERTVMALRVSAWRLG